MIHYKAYRGYIKTTQINNVSPDNIWCGLGMFIDTYHDVKLSVVWFQILVLKKL